MDFVLYYKLEQAEAYCDIAEENPSVWNPYNSSPVFFSNFVEKDT
jgi:hypothetical protein